MKKYILIAFLGVAVLFAVFALQRNNTEQTQEINNSFDAAQIEVIQDDISVQSKNGIEIAVTSIEQGTDTTTVQLALSNHRFDLSDSSIYKTAYLDESEPASYEFLSNAVGGHHVEVMLVFPKTESGNLSITPAENTEFIFDDLWK